MTISLIVSLIEVTILRFIGALVDFLRSTSPAKVPEAHGGEFLAMGLLILVGRMRFVVPGAIACWTMRSWVKARQRAAAGEVVGEIANRLAQDMRCVCQRLPGWVNV